MSVDKQVSKCIIIYSLIRITCCVKISCIKSVNHLRNKPSRTHIREKMHAANLLLLLIECEEIRSLVI